MKFLKKMLQVALAVFFFALLATSTVLAADADSEGWKFVQENGRTYYKKGDLKETAWRVIDGKYYYFDHVSGEMVVGWLEKKEVDGLCFSLSHNLPNKNYGGDLSVGNNTDKFDQLLDEETDVAVYGHVHKQLLRYGSQGQQIINPGTIGMPYFDWEALKNHRAQYAVIEVEDGELVNILFRKVSYDYEAELELAKSKGLPFIEMYEELRREDNYRGHNLELLTSLIEKYGYVEDVKKFLEAIKSKYKID